MTYTQSDLLERFYYFKYHNRILRNLEIIFFTLKTKLIIHKASIYLSQDLILFTFKFIFKEFFLFLLKEFIMY